MLKRILSLLLALGLLLPLPALADGNEWTCPNCGQTGNTGNFCSNCATARPAAEWTCPSCGQTGNTGNFCSNCATARPDGKAESAAETVVTVSEHLEQIPGEADRVKVCPDKVEASSFIANKKNPNLWIPENAVDGDESTCWQFSAKKGLKGKSWIRLDLPEAETVDEIWFKNGFWAVNDKGRDQYPINARPHDVKVEFLYAGETKFADAAELSLKDESRNGWQQFSLGRHDRVTQVRISVISVYKGSSFPNDVCLSEAMLVQHAPAASARPAQTEKAATVYASDPSVTGCSLKMKLATRSGPSTEYEEPGTFFGSNWQKQTVKVLKKSFDGSVWWVQVDFRNGSKSSYRVWTGVKRVDVDLNQLSESRPIGITDVRATDTWYGPGGNYANTQKMIVYGEGDLMIYSVENGYVEVDYYDVNWECQRRVWVPEKALYNTRWY